MIHWNFMVARSAGDERRAAAFLAPLNADAYYALAGRLRQGGMRPTNRVLWRRFAIDLTACTVTVQNGFFVELHTSRSRLAAMPPQRLTDSWCAAAELGAVLVGLAPPDTLPFPGVGVASPAATELSGELIDELAESGRLIVGFARVLDQPAPLAGPGQEGFRL